MSAATLLEAAREGDVARVRCLVVDNGYSTAVACPATRMTPLHLAARGGHAALAEMLLSQRAPVDARDARGLAPIHHAAVAGHTRIIQMLMDRGADRSHAAQLALQGQHPAAAAMLQQKDPAVRRAEARCAKLEEALAVSQARADALQGAVAYAVEEIEAMRSGHAAAPRGDAARAAWQLRAAVDGLKEETLPTLRGRICTAERERDAAEEALQALRSPAPAADRLAAAEQRRSAVEEALEDVARLLTDGDAIVPAMRDGAPRGPVREGVPSALHVLAAEVPGGGGALRIVGDAFTDAEGEGRSARCALHTFLAEPAPGRAALQKVADALAAAVFPAVPVLDAARGRACLADPGLAPLMRMA
eukprot:TRINITY_DN11523_c0_g1_i1.p1 TRINITY_DN11523_c0_g1~~TRINITY_DN11523_c0_g1_i1.p1  ORF type:complete len:378 (+),score=119.62 TRINITY_DN11523_c0_g1_i1:50-1135(+)